MHVQATLKLKLKTEVLNFNFSSITTLECKMKVLYHIKIWPKTYIIQTMNIDEKNEYGIFENMIANPLCFHEIEAYFIWTPICLYTMLINTALHLKWHNSKLMGVWIVLRMWTVKFYFLLLARLLHMCIADLKLFITLPYYQW